jgi:hypothetical protein
MNVRIAFVIAAGLVVSHLHFATESLTFGADHVVIVLDDSGSMNEGMQGSRIRKMEAAKNALGTVISQIAEGTNVGVLLLNGARSTNHWLVPLGPLNKPDAIAKVNRISANGGTPLGEAMRLAADELLRARSKSIYGTYRLIVVSDGEATDQRLLDQYLPDILARGLVVDAIGVNMRTEHSLATRVHSYRRADDETSLRNAIVEILAENSDQDSNASEADFELLNALNDVDAGAILQALATPNNAEISGFPNRDSSASRIGGSNPAPFTPGPASIPIQTQAPESSFVSQVFGTFCTCMLPILIAIMIFITVASRNKRKKSR